MKASNNSSTDNSEIVDVLNDLIRINKDRIAGYDKALENLQEGDAILRTLFAQLSEESHKLRDELSAQVVVLGGEPAEDTTMSGKIYRAWMEVKDTFSSDDAKSALEACEGGEDAAQKAYAEALEDSTNFPTNIRSMIEDQKGLLKISHDLVRNKRDDYEAATQRAHY